MNTELLKSILSVVSEVCEIDEDAILSHCKRNDIVDARCIFIHFAARKYGIKTQTIAKFLNRKRVCTINDCLSNHNIYSEQSFSYRLMCRNVAEKLSAIYPETPR